VYLGPYSAASRSKMQTLLDYKITHIVCVRHAIEANIIKPNFLDKFKYAIFLMQIYYALAYLSSEFVFYCPIYSTMLFVDI